MYRDLPSAQRLEALETARTGPLGAFLADTANEDAVSISRDRAARTAA